MTFQAIYKITLLLVVMFFLNACSPTQKTYRQNIDIYFSSKQDLLLTDEEVKQAPYDLVYVKNGERATATMALGFIENGQYKWLSKDNVMLVTENGRLVRTLGLDKNLVHVSALNKDPINQIANRNFVLQQWDRTIDTSDGDFGARLNSSFEVEYNVPLQIHEHTMTAIKVTESVNYRSVILTENTFDNVFWYDVNTKALLKSYQYPSSTLDPIEITYISRALRLTESAQ
ncbi:MAG: YjbF family lipoprotein [Glaciecola sp.]